MACGSAICSPSIILYPYRESSGSMGLVRALRLLPPIVRRCRRLTYRQHDVCLWHFASFAATHHFGRSWGKSGHWSELALNLSVVNDPERT